MALIPVAVALERVLADAHPLSIENVSLNQAHGRVLAQDLAAKRTQPPHDVSAMDGYAVRGADLAKFPVTLEVVGEVPAGRPFARDVGSGQAVRIFTGGVMPTGTDSIVVQENTMRDGNTVTIAAPSPAGKHIRRAGIDFRQGDKLLAAGTLLSSRAVMLAAAMNYPVVPVYRRPKVAIFGTGDELVPPGSEPGDGEIVYSNGFALSAMARAEGCEVIELGIARDELGAITGAIRKARDAEADVLVTTGGASVGDYDLVQKALAAEGLKLSFWKMAMRPGRPMMHGRLGDMQVLGLPGNPVSSFVCAFLFLVPLVRRLCGRTDIGHVAESATLGAALSANDERADYLRASLKVVDGVPVATPMPVQDSSLMARLSQANCLILRDPHAPAAPAGSHCVILKLPL